MLSLVLPCLEDLPWMMSLVRKLFKKFEQICEKNCRAKSCHFCTCKVKSKDHNLCEFITFAN
jgi:hypothetical protein